jgi:TIR domain
MSKPIIFISYSHKNEVEKDELVEHLDVIVPGSEIDLWNDDRIEAGGDWEAHINEAMAKARVAVLLITKEFINSKFIKSKEVPKILERREKDGLIVFPVIARASAWQTVTWLRAMNVKPKNGTPIWGKDRGHRDAALAKIAVEVYAAISKPKDQAKTEPQVTAITPSPISTRPALQDVLANTSSGAEEKQATSAGSLRIESTTADVKVNLAAQEMPVPQRTIIKVGNTEFVPIEYSDLDQLTMLAQSLDNQWVPRGLLLQMLEKGLALTDRAVEMQRNQAVRSEYIRALINARQIVINRAYLFTMVQTKIRRR